jgi:hypothetical protein
MTIESLILTEDSIQSFGTISSVSREIVRYCSESGVAEVMSFAPEARWCHSRAGPVISPQ